MTISVLLNVVMDSMLKIMKTVMMGIMTLMMGAINAK